MFSRIPVPVKRLILVLFSGGIFWLSHQPSLRLIPPLFPLQDKVFHAGEFFFLGIAIYMNRDLFGRLRKWFLMALAGILWSAIDEIHQSFVVGRDCSAGDFLADCVGVLAALLLLGLRSGEKISWSAWRANSNHSPDGEV